MRAEPESAAGSALGSWASCWRLISGRETGREGDEGSLESLPASPKVDGKRRWKRRGTAGGAQSGGLVWTPDGEPLRLWGGAQLQREAVEGELGIR